MSENAKVSGHEEEPPKKKSSGGAGLTVENLWNCLDIVTVFFEQLSPRTVSDWKSIRLVNLEFSKRSLNEWRNAATLRICSHEDYERYQANPQLAGSVTGVSFQALMDELERNENLKLKENPFHSYSIRDYVNFPFPTGEENPFWNSFGQEIKFLKLSAVNFGQINGENGFKCLLQQCPNLEHLVINMNTSRTFIKFNRYHEIFETIFNPNHRTDFEQKQLKSFTIEQDQVIVGEDNYPYGAHKVKDLFIVAPAIETFHVDCFDCSHILLAMLNFFAHTGKRIKLKSFKMKFELGKDLINLADYINLAECQFQQLNLEIILKSTEIQENITFEPLKLCKDSLEDLTLKLNGLRGNSEIHPDLGELSGCTFSAMKSFTLKLKYWREGALGYPGGVSFPLLTTLKIISFCHEGEWFDLLKNCSFPSLTRLEISFEWEDHYRISNNLDFSTLKAMPKLERLCFKDVNDDDGLYPSNLVTTYVVTPYKMLYKSSPYALERSVEPDDYYSFLCLENMTVFYYPTLFSVDSLLLIRKWMPNLRVLGIGADMDCLDAIFSLFMDLNKITLFVKFDTEDDMFKKVMKGFPGKLHVVRVG